MSEISGITGNAGTNPAQSAQFRSGPLSGRTVSSPAIQRGSDQVEVSKLSTYLQSLRNTPKVREDLVAQVRRELDAGVYHDAKALDPALDEMIREAQSDQL